MARPEIAALDRALAADGETVLIRRRVGKSVDQFAEVTARTRLSGYAGVDAQAGIELRDSKFILSPTPFSGSPDWPGDAGGDVLPRRGDFIVSQGVQRHVEQALAIKIGDEVVRIEGRIR